MLLTTILKTLSLAENSNRIVVKYKRETILIIDHDSDLDEFWFNKNISQTE
jgi:hypothetical protein